MGPRFQPQMSINSEALVSNPITWINKYFPLKAIRWKDPKLVIYRLGKKAQPKWKKL